MLPELSQLGRMGEGRERESIQGRLQGDGGTAASGAYGPSRKPASEVVQAHFGHKKVEAREKRFCPMYLHPTRILRDSLKGKQTAPEAPPTWKSLLLAQYCGKVIFQTFFIFQTLPLKVVVSKPS